MNVQVTGRRFDLDEKTKERALQEVEKLTKFFDNITSANLVLTQDNFRCEGELTMNVARSKLVAKASTEDMFSTIEQVTDKMAKQLKKHKGKLKDKDQRKLSDRKAKVDLTTGVDEVEF
jgi:putative sigma-54 modulation protein